MAIVRRFLRLSTVGGAASLGAFFWTTRNDVFVPMTLSDHIFHSAPFHALNPSRNPTTHDLCVRKVPLSDINPALLEKKGKLVEAFCAGVWGGWGMFSLLKFISVGPSIDLFGNQDLHSSAHTWPGNTKGPKLLSISGHPRNCNPPPMTAAP